jgi:hypothetical protein
VGERLCRRKRKLVVVEAEETGEESKPVAYVLLSHSMISFLGKSLSYEFEDQQGVTT